MLDWDGKQHVRVAALEKKLDARMKDRDGSIRGLAEDEVRAALGVAKKEQGPRRVRRDHRCGVLPDKDGPDRVPR
ncbi:MAG TPA: hypothetical protein VK932_22425 [Kofleriaceae bacterium]|nr:hypothetical protein [Kofleriaceae bacterium]